MFNKLSVLLVFIICPLESEAIRHQRIAFPCLEVLAAGRIWTLHIQKLPTDPGVIELNTHIKPLTGPLADAFVKAFSNPMVARGTTVKISRTQFADSNETKPSGRHVSHRKFNLYLETPSVLYPSIHVSGNATFGAPGSQWTKEYLSEGEIRISASQRESKMGIPILSLSFTRNRSRGRPPVTPDIFKADWEAGEQSELRFLQIFHNSGRQIVGTVEDERGELPITRYPSFPQIDIYVVRAPTNNTPMNRDRTQVWFIPTAEPSRKVQYGGWQE